jgi:CRISPR/Cas system-associated endonuclease Cas1
MNDEMEEIWKEAVVDVLVRKLARRDQGTTSQLG